MSAEIRRRTMSELQAITFNTNGVECIVTIDISGLTRDGQPVSSLPVTISSNAPPPNFVVSIDGKTTTPEPVEQLEQLDHRDRRVPRRQSQPEPPHGVRVDHGRVVADAQGRLHQDRP